MERKTFILEYRFDIFKISFSFIVVLAVNIFSFSNYLDLILYISALLVVGCQVFFEGMKKLFHGEIFNENTLMILASIVAVLIGEYLESILIMTLFCLGELLEDVATKSAKIKIVDGYKLNSETVHLISGNKIVDCSPKDVKVGSLVQVNCGDRVCIDGIVIKGGGEFDFKAITGESKYYYLSEGDKVYSGGINLGEAVIIKTTKLYEDSIAEKIINAVEEANKQKAKSQKFITVFSKIYTPIIVSVAIFIAFIMPLFDEMNFYKWIYKALSFIVVSCPCALVISIPLAFFVSIGNMAKKGIVVKGSKYVDCLSKVKSAVFDKTGTLTEGKFSIEKIEAFNGYDKDEILKIACSIEKYSSHPMATAINEYGNNLQLFDTLNVKERAGLGMSGRILDKEILIGNSKLVNENVYDDYYSIILVKIDNILSGIIYLTDKIKDGAKTLKEDLYALNVKKTYIVSGDSENICERVGKELNFDKWYFELLPNEKVKKLNEIKNKDNGKVIYVGDGINDAPSIASGDVGIAMGGLGSQIAIDNANVVIMDDDLSKISTAIKYSKKTRRKVIVNIVGSLSIKLSVMVLSLFITLPVFIATFADVGVMLLAVLNSIIYYEPKKTVKAS